MTPQEVADEYDRRLNKIYDLYEEAIKAPIQAVQAAAAQKSRARKKLDTWYVENYNGTVEVRRLDD